MRLKLAIVAVVLLHGPLSQTHAQDKLTLLEKRTFFWFDRLEFFERGQLADTKLVRVSLRYGRTRTAASQHAGRRAF